MAGRVRRKLGLDEAARRTPDGPPPRCALCHRPLGTRVEWHHVVPRSEGGVETVAVHPICHRAIHAALPNQALARAGSIDAIRADPAIARFLDWIADKPADFHAPTHGSRRH